MLVMSRRKNEEVVITPSGSSGSLIVTVVEIRDDKVRIGFQCPRDWELHRREVYDQIHGHDAAPGSE